MAQFASSLHIDNKPLRERILDVLREAIITGELKPGQPLIEVDLASQLGVSRAPLREALQTLAREGLVETMPYRGSVVRVLTRTDIEELYSLRSVLESFAVRRLIAQHQPTTVSRLREIYERMLSTAQTGDLAGVNHIDREFHDALIELSQHSLLLMTWSSVSNRVRQVMALRNERNDDITTIAHNHLPIIEAIEQGDVALATSLIQKHVATSGDLLAEHWDDAPQDGTS
jgi:DNA-binding GntR family transcriptional regulator